MQQLSDEQGYAWSGVTFTDGSRGMWSVDSDVEGRQLLESAMAASEGIVVVGEPFDGPASAAVLASPLAGGGWGVPQVSEVVAVLAPEAVDWATATFVRGQSLAATGSSIDETFSVPDGQLRVTGGGDQAVVQLLLTPVSALPPSATRAPGADGSVTFGDGSYQVGIDVAPGTYRLREPPGRCTWQRFGDPATDAAPLAMRSAPGFAVVTILPTDSRFVSSGCGTWSEDLSAVLLPGQAIPGDGVFIVGTDVEPGTYQNGGDADVLEPHGPLCLWARLSDLADPSHALQSGLGRERFTVTIEATDAGFQTDGCEGWVRR
jgi:hypothetical protein